MAPATEFDLRQPTHVIAGRGVAEQVGALAATYGPRALLVCGEDHAQASGLLARVRVLLGSAGMQVELLEGVPGDPPTSVVDAGAALARAWKADLVVGLGGGSVIDAAKAIATAAREGRPFRTHLSGIRRPGLHVVEALPVVAVPTMTGSGAETNGTSVIIDDETGRKLSAHTDLAAPRIALLDPELVESAPASVLGPGLADAACHAVEAALSQRASVASDALAEQALRLLLRHAEAAMPRALPESVDPVDDEAVEAAAAGQREERLEALLACMWATNLAGQALTAAGSIVTHPLAHPLSARLGAHHGAAVAALEPAVLVRLGDRFGERPREVASWMGSRPKDARTGLRALVTRLGRLFAALGVEASIEDLGMAEELVGQVVRDARLSGSRGLANVPGGEPSLDELYAIVDLAMRVGPTATAKRQLDASAVIDRAAEKAGTSS